MTVSYFIAESNDRTRIELDHRRLDRYGARRDELRGIFDSDILEGDPRRVPARAAEG